MYMLAGPPFKRSTRGNVFDCAEEEIRVYPGARAALQQLAEDDAFLETKIAYASRSNRTKWGLELLQLLPVREGGGLSLRQAANHSLIYPGCKKNHFQELRRDTGLAYTEMLFFDNERINVEEVSQLGVVCVHCPRGMTVEVWESGLKEYAKVANFNR